MRLFTGLPEALNDSQFLTPRLTREQSGAAIEGPSKVRGGRVEPALVSRLLNDMGAEPDQLPLMQHVLLRMWNHAASRTRERSGTETVVTLEDYEYIGRFDRALSVHADEVYLKLDDSRRRIADILFRSLSERSHRRDTRRPTRLGHVAEVAEERVNVVAEVVEVFRHPDLCLLTPLQPSPLDAETLIDVTHESVIRQWSRLRGEVAADGSIVLKGLVEREEESAKQYLYIKQTARRWNSGEAELWTGVDLDVALEWRDQERPNAVWASRYGGDFFLAMRFLEQSRLTRDAVEKFADLERAEAAGDFLATTPALSLPRRHYQLVVLGPSADRYPELLGGKLRAAFEALGLDPDVDLKIVQAGNAGDFDEFVGIPAGVWFGGEGEPSPADLDLLERLQSSGRRSCPWSKTCGNSHNLCPGPSIR